MKVRYSHRAKTGGSSIVKALRTKWEDTPHTHRVLLSRDQVKQQGIDFSFATVRHPYEIVLDTYNYFKRINKNFSLNEFITLLG